MKSASGKLNAKYYVLLRRAEEAKITLSSKTSAEIVVDGFEDEDETRLIWKLSLLVLNSTN
ncbi:MAG: hypothetical protein IPH33_12780 [Bacteroidetes bacterium]|nr:hypothetical protein [Bacteroidota bacterium]